MTMDHIITLLDQFDKSEESIDAPFQREWNIINQVGGAILLLFKNFLRPASYMWNALTLSQRSSTLIFFQGTDQPEIWAHHCKHPCKQCGFKQHLLLWQNCFLIGDWKWYLQWLWLKWTNEAVSLNHRWRAAKRMKMMGGFEVRGDIPQSAFGWKTGEPRNREEQGFQNRTL